MPSPLNVSGSFGAGPSEASNRVGSVFMGGMHIPAYPAFPESPDFAANTATQSRPVAGWGVVEPMGWAILGAGLLLVGAKLGGKL